MSSWETPLVCHSNISIKRSLGTAAFGRKGTMSPSLLPTHAQYIQNNHNKKSALIVYHATVITVHITQYMSSNTHWLESAFQA